MTFISFIIICSLFRLVASDVDLPLGEINVLVLTDVHSWVGGHGSNEQVLNADYGDVVSFYEQLKLLVDDRDIFFVMNGDFIDGTGMSMNGDAFSLTQVLEKMPWDAVNIGNHDLYHEKVVKFIQEPGGLVDWFGKAYLSSNIRNVDDAQSPIGHKYTVMRGKETAVLTFGFLYNMKDHVDIVTVAEVEEVMQETWFAAALHDEVYDGIVVLAHMHCNDPLVSVILNKIRQEVGPTMPVQFITGHTHHRRYAELDDWSTSFEAGRYLDTLGFVSFPKHSTILDQKSPLFANGTTESFEYKYLDANKEIFRETLGVDVLPTKDGAALSEFIATIQEKKGLTEVLGCVDKTYYLTNGTYHDSSLWGFFAKTIAPQELNDGEFIMLNKGVFRYDLLQGRVQLGHAIEVAPFNDTLFMWKGLPGSVIQQLNDTLNAKNETWMPDLPAYILAGKETISPDASYNFMTDFYDRGAIQRAMIDIYPNASGITPVPLSLTVTNMLIDYFRFHSPCDGNEPSSSPPEKKRPFSWGIPPRNTVNNTKEKRPQPTESEKDEARLGFVGMAILAMLILGSINVWQRGQSHQLFVETRERETMEALREYQQDLEDSDDEEGRFV